MKRKLLIPSTFVSTTLFGQKKHYVIQAAGCTRVKFADNFWLPRININYTVTLPASFEQCEFTGREKNFDVATGGTDKFCTTCSFKSRTL